MAIKQRLKKLECGSLTQFRDIIQLIRKGAYYDELNKEQQARYKLYRESLGGVADDISLAELGLLMHEDPAAFHFQLQPRKRPPTAEEHAQAVEELEEWYNKCVEEYNSPKEVEKRKREYEEHKRNTRLKWQAFIDKKR